MLNKSQIFAQFISNLFGGAIFTSLTIYFFILIYGFSTPADAELITIIPTIIGVILTELLFKRSNYKFYYIILGAFILLPIITLLLMGFEDWFFPFMMSIISIIYSLIPAAIITLATNWRKFPRKKQ